MKLELKGVGPIRDTEVTLDGLTVILGENGSGKSTILRSLYCVADAPLDFKVKRISEVRNSVSDLLLRRTKGESDYDDSMTVLETVMNRIRTGDIDGSLAYLRNVLNKKGPLDSDSESTLGTIERILKGGADQELINTMAARDVVDEFTSLRQMRDLSYDRPASAIISFNDESFGFQIDTKDRCRWSGDVRDFFPSVVYYDTPFVLDEADPTIRVHKPRGHRDALAYRIVPRRDISIIDEMKGRSDAERFYDILHSVIEGEFQVSMNGLYYVDGRGRRMNASNLAAGAKVFAVLELLAGNGLLSKDSLVLLDEPEVHLHPGWINTLARLIVLLRRDMGARVVMTTHSPQLLLAVQAVSMEYGIHTDYYSLSVDDSGASTVSDMHGDLRPVYTLMSRYFQEADIIYRRSADDEERPSGLLESNRFRFPQEHPRALWRPCRIHARNQ